MINLSTLQFTYCVIFQLLCLSVQDKDENVIRVCAAFKETGFCFWGFFFNKRCLESETKSGFYYSIFVPPVKCSLCLSKYC